MRAPSVPPGILREGVRQQARRAEAAGERAEGRRASRGRHWRHRAAPRVRSSRPGPEPEKAPEGEVRRLGSGVIRAAASELGNVTFKT